MLGADFLGLAEMRFHRCSHVSTKLGLQSWRPRQETSVPSGRTVSWVGLLKVLLLLMSMLMVVKQK